MNRQQRRAMQKHVGKETTEEMSQKLSQFEKLPEQCSACNKEFDKKDKEMIQSWNVIVKQETVRLFCPECIKKTQEIINEHR
tara:strand:+ start:3045 stop:3290 length:246 start_codon:yes stop_codon:yes gene_type:complete